MASRREQILAALAVTLAAVDGVQFERSRTRAIDLAKLATDPARPSRPHEPVATLRPAGEEITLMPGDRADRTLTVDVTVYWRGTVPDQGVDAACLALHAAMVGDHTVGGLAYDVREVSREWLIDPAELDSIEATLRYAVLYRTQRDDETTAG